MTVTWRSLFNPSGKAKNRPSQTDQTSPATDPALSESRLYAVVLKEHLAILVSGILVSFAAVKIIIFARSDYSLALAVLSAGQQFTILASTMFNALVILAMLFVSIPTLTLRPTQPPEDKGRLIQHYLMRYLPLLMAWGLLLIAAPIFYLAVAAFFAWFDGFTSRRRKKKKRQADPARQNRRKTAIFLLSANIVMLVITLAAGEWSPQENIAFRAKDVDHHSSGFMIGQQGKQLLFVSSDRSTTHWISEDAIISRTLCSSRGGTDWYEKSVLGAIASLNSRPGIGSCAHDNV